MIKLKNETNELNNEQINDNEYCNCLTDVNSEVNFNTLLLNKTIFKYSIRRNELCSKCKNINICHAYINRIRTKLMKLEYQSSTYKENINFNPNVELDIKTIKLNCTSVKLSSNKSKSKNKELIRRIERMNLNNEEIKVLTL